MSTPSPTSNGNSNVVDLFSGKSLSTIESQRIIRLSPEYDGLTMLYSSAKSNTDTLYTMKILCWGIRENGEVVGMVPWLNKVVACEDLQDPITREALIRRGVNPDELEPDITEAEQLRARGRTLALGVGTLAAGVTGVATRTMLSTVPRFALEGLAFGVTEGSLTPLEEAETRAGRVLTSTVLATGIGTITGLGAAAARRLLTARGIKPQLETPEISPTPREYSPTADARAPITDPRRLLAPPKAEHGPAVRLGTERTALEVTREAAQRAATDFFDDPRVGRLQTPYGEAVNEALDVISIGQRGKRGKPLRQTLDDLYTEAFDDLHPLNVATKDLLRLRNAAVRELKAKGVELARVGEAPGAALVRREVNLPATELLERASETRSLIPGERLPGLDDPYILARLSRGSVPQALEMIESGPLNFATLRPVGPGIREITRPIVEAGRLDELRAFLIAPRTLDFAALGRKTPLSVEAAQAIIKGAPPDIVLAGQAFFDFNKSVLEYLRDSGAISPGLFDAFRKATENYVSFGRFFEDIPEPTVLGVPRPGKRFIHLGQLRRAHGSTIAGIIDPVESVIANTTAMVSMANRHVVVDALVRLAESVPGQEIVRRVGRFRGLQKTKDMEVVLREAGVEVPPAILDEMATAISPRKVGENRFVVNRGGERILYEVDKELYSTLAAMDVRTIGPLMRLLSAPTSLFRAGVILDPAFSLARNPFRDKIGSLVFSKHNAVPSDLFRGIFSVLQKDELFRDFTRAQGSFSSMVRSLTTDRAAAQKVFRQLLAANHPFKEFATLARNPSGMIEMLRILSEGFENSTRVREFARAMEATGDARLAGFASREISLDFQKMGASVRIANQLSPFLAANIQGVEKLVRQAGQKPLNFTARAMAFITLPTIALWLINFDDPAYQQLPWWRRDLFWNIPFWRWNDQSHRLEKTGQFFPIPAPFEMGLIYKAFPERVLQWIAEHDESFSRVMTEGGVPVGDPFEDYLSNLLDQLTPGTLPVFLGPLLEARTGYDLFLDRRIVPEGEERLLDEFQAGPAQGETVRVAGKYLKMSPRIVENTIVGFTGGLGRSALATTDQILRAFGVRGDVQLRSPRDVIPLIGPLISAFIVEEPTLNSKASERFYNAWGEMAAINSTIRSLERKGQFADAQVIAQNSQPEVIMYSDFSRTVRDLAEFREIMRLIRTNPDLTFAERKEQLLQLGRAFRTLAGSQLSAYTLLQKRMEVPDSELAPFDEGPGVLQFPQQ
ncbi:hypothetical protein LCGC14_1044370 [marine sediment metagenome]|uniref:Large polyvalent protein associated domain-containing protein n=1 Tax=marine sediment metagenome TaxID=412755 RepID=A0A0F9Q8Y2_9ZZZZ